MEYWSTEWGWEGVEICRFEEDGDGVVLEINRRPSETMKIECIIRDLRSLRMMVGRRVYIYLDITNCEVEPCSFTELAILIERDASLLSAATA